MIPAVTGPAEPRVAALAHLETCGACHRLMRELAADTDLLLLLAPPAEPPPGFAERVVESLTPSAPSPTSRPRPRAGPRPRRGVLIPLAVAACLALVALVLSVGRSDSPAVATADMRTPAGDVVGNVVLQRDPSAALFLTVPGWVDQVERYGEPGDAYALRIGHSAEAPLLVPLDLGAAASWAIDLDIDPYAITDIAVVDGEGDVWCEAEI